MKKSLYILAFLGTMIGLSACDSGPGNPTESDLMAMMAGTYCSEDAQHRLELKADGHYMNKRLRRNPFGGSSLPESCEGSFSFVEDGDSWKLVFNKSDKKSNPMIPSCKGEVLVWNKEKGYVLGDSLIQLEDLFDGTPLTNLNCGQ